MVCALMVCAQSWICMREVEAILTFTSLSVLQIVARRCIDLRLFSKGDLALLMLDPSMNIGRHCPLRNRIARAPWKMTLGRRTLTACHSEELQTMHFNRVRLLGIAKLFEFLDLLQ